MGSCAAPFVEQLFRKAPLKLKKIYYKFTKEKDQIIFSYMVSFVTRGANSSILNDMFVNKRK